MQEPRAVLVLHPQIKPTLQTTRLSLVVLQHVKRSVACRAMTIFCLDSRCVLCNEPSSVAIFIIGCTNDMPYSFPPSSVSDSFERICNCTSSFYWRLIMGAYPGDYGNVASGTHIHSSSIQHTLSVTTVKRSCYLLFFLRIHWTVVSS